MTVLIAPKMVTEGPVFPPAAPKAVSAAATTICVPRQLLMRMANHLYACLLLISLSTTVA